MSQRIQRRAITAVFAIIVAIATIFAVLYFAPLQKEVTLVPTTPDEQARYEALGAAQRFVPSSPTFAFDGDINTLKTEYVGSTKSIPEQHMFVATFDSSHGGFGDRGGQDLTQAITPHKMDIIVSEGRVISAVTDETWDELNRQFVPERPE